MTVVTRVIAVVGFGLALATIGAQASTPQPQESHYSAAFPQIRNGLWHGDTLPIVPRRVIHLDRTRRT